MVLITGTWSTTITLGFSPLEAQNGPSRLRRRPQRQSRLSRAPLKTIVPRSIPLGNAPQPFPEKRSCPRAFELVNDPRRRTSTFTSPRPAPFRAQECEGQEKAPADRTVIELHGGGSGDSGCCIACSFFSADASRDWRSSLSPRLQSKFPTIAPIKPVAIVTVDCKTCHV